MKRSVLFIICIFYALALSAQMSSESQVKVKFKDFPSNEALRAKVKNAVQQHSDIEKLKASLDKIARDGGVKSCHVDFTVRTGISYIWYHQENNNQFTALFATRGGYGEIEDYRLLLEEWRDTLEVVDTMVLSIDSAIYTDGLISFRCIDEQSKAQRLSIDRKGRKTTFHAAVTENTTFLVELKYKSRTEVLTLCFLGDATKKALVAELSHYLPFDYSDEELCQIALTHLPQLKNLDRGALGRFLRKH